MRDLSGVIEQLRNVREAERRFLQLWAVEREVILPGLDRVAADIDAAPVGNGGWGPPSAGGTDPGQMFGE